jgi:hypothetical protein
MRAGCKTLRSRLHSWPRRTTGDRTAAHRKRDRHRVCHGASALRKCVAGSRALPRSRHAENVTRASLLDVDLTHPFLLANDLDLIA